MPPIAPPPHPTPPDAPRWAYDVDLDTRRGRIVWTLTLIAGIALVWIPCLLAYALALWAAGMLQ